MAVALATAPAGAFTLDPDDTRQGRAIERVPIGGGGDFKDYLRIDTPCPLRVMGPGTLDFYVRAHLPPGAPDTTTARVALDGLKGFPRQTWTLALESSSSSGYGDARVGGVTGGRKVSLAIPQGLHEMVVSGTSTLREPVYAIFYYNGPSAPSRADAKRPSPWTVDGNFSFGTIYDDNVCRYSDDTLARFVANAEPWRYAITNREDVIFDTQVQVEVGRRFLPGRDTSARLTYERWDYVENGIKTNDEIQLRLRQDTRSSDYVALTYTYAPDSYIKELGDREPFLSWKTTPYTYYHFYITRNAFDLDYYWRASRTFRTMFMSGRVLRFYNQRFLENDLWEWNIGVEPEARYGRFYARVRYMYHHVKARGFDTVGETIETSDNDGDGSYEKDAYRFRLTYRPKSSPYRIKSLGTGLAVIPGFFRQIASWIDHGLVAIRTSYIYFQYDYTRQFYTSERPLYVDPLHVGRLDVMNQPRVVWTSKSLWNRIALEAGIRYTVKTAESPAGVIGEDDPSEEKDYTGTRVWLSASRPLW